MNRTIKFRGWDKQDNEWLKNHSNAELVARTTSGTDSRFILMQFTGLTDRNGKEIYEGDILDTPRMSKPMLWFIEWDETRGRWQAITKNKKFFKGASEVARKGEVIGNVFENSSLLPSPDNQ